MSSRVRLLFKRRARKILWNCRVLASVSSACGTGRPYPDAAKLPFVHDSVPDTKT